MHCFVGVDALVIANSEYAGIGPKRNENKRLGALVHKLSRTYGQARTSVHFGLSRSTNRFRYRMVYHFFFVVLLEGAIGLDEHELRTMRRSGQVAVSAGGSIEQHSGPLFFHKQQSCSTTPK